jgi:hypothetical protein
LPALVCGFHSIAMDDDIDDLIALGGSVGDAAVPDPGSD